MAQAWQQPSPSSNPQVVQLYLCVISTLPPNDKQQTKEQTSTTAVRYSPALDGVILTRHGEGAQALCSSLECADHGQ
jgi:hypothetical protein